MPTLTIDHLNKSFGETQALRDMTCSVGDGEIFGFVGSNGAGQSHHHAHCAWCAGERLRRSLFR